MIEAERLRDDLESLRSHNLQLTIQLADAQQALSAFAHGQVDAVAHTASSTPVLLEAAQAQLVRSKRLLRSVFDGSLDALLLDDDRGVHVDVNAAACELFGLSRDQLLGQRLAASATSALDSEPRSEEHEDVNPSRLTGSGHYTLRRADGARRTLDYRAVPNVAPGLHLLAMRDVTEQIAAQDALRSSEARFRAMIEKSHDGISLHGADARTLYQSPAVERLLGYDLAGADRARWQDLLEAGELSKLEASLEQLLQWPSATVALELRIRHRDGSRRWLELSATNLLHDPNIGALVTNFRDITARKHFEAALRETELRYRNLIEELPEPLLVHVDQVIVFANAASARVLGLESAQQLLGRSLREFATAATRARMDTQTARSGTDAALELAEQSYLRLSDGLEVHAEVKSISILFDGRAATLSIASDVTRRVEAEREAALALRNADLERRKLEAVLAALPVGVWIADAAGALTITNPAAARLWGGRAPHAKSPSQYGVYKGYWTATGKLMAPEEWGLARALATGETVVAEASSIERFDGTYAHVLNSAAAILDDDGKIVGGVAVMLDVSIAHQAAAERERLIASLEFERRRLGMLLAKAPAFIAVMRGKEHVFDLVNDAYSELIGGREVLGKPLSEALEEVRGQGFVELLDRVMASGEPFVANGMPVLLSRTPNSALERRYINFVYQPLIESDGTISGVFLHGVDVTDATVAEQRLRAQFHGVPVPTYVWQRIEGNARPYFTLSDYNQAALTVSQGAIAEQLGQTADVYFADAPEIIADLERCLSLGAMHAREMDWKPKGATELRRLYVSYAPAPPDLVIVHAADVTERVELEQQLRQAQKMEAVGRLAGGVAHDFNNLLSVILSYSELAIEGLRPGDPLRRDIEQIQRAGRRATDLTHQLLAFSRQQVLEPRVIDLEQIVTAMKPMLGRLLGEDVELVVVAAPAAGLVLADPGQVEQVVMNLAVNARDAMPEGGKLTIETVSALVEAYAAGKPDTVPPGRFVVLTISDSGSGMDPATIGRIFEPFFTTKEMGKGTGLGLSTVFGIVHQSGGFISVDSELGRGTTFRVYLPRTDRLSADSTSSLGPPSPRRGTETILLVEDEEQLREVACEILRRNGYRVLGASNGGEAYLVAQEYGAKIDLLLTDVIMPRMSGRKLAEQLAPLRPEMKVLFASGYTDDVVIRHGVLEAGVAFLQKPFTPYSLLGKVREVLDER
ncbi:MAG: domain S-box protein [Myxococcaceae bacterium]|nr:domain S-box protein [Myxococcaceae bacterium]